MLNSKKVAEITGGTLWGEPFAEVSGWSIDSRKAAPGQAFVAFKGENTDGHRFIEQAFTAGVSLVLAELSGLEKAGASPDRVPEGRAIVGVQDSLRALQQLAKAWAQELNPIVVGVTGSNGKTTTKDMVHAVLSAKYTVHKNLENYNNEIGLPLTVLNAPPEAEIMVLEMGMRGLGQIKALCQICRPRLGIITNIGSTHLELLGSRENIAAAKWELIDSLPADGTAILNAEDFFSVQKAAESNIKKVFYGLEGCYTKPDVRGAAIQADSELKTRFEVLAGERKALVELPLPGEHNVLDSLAALACGLELGVTLEEGAEALRQLQLSKMRLEMVEGIAGSMILNDVYNANPVSMQASLKVLAERGGAKTVAILGDMYELGEAAAEGHREVGAAAAALGIKTLITVGSLAKNIAEGAIAEGFPQDCLHICETCEQAAPLAIETIEKFGPGTWVLVKGSRGMKMERISRQLSVRKGNDEK